MTTIELIHLNLIKSILTHSFGSNSIITPKIQELNSINLFDCLINAKLTDERRCEDDDKEILSETKQSYLRDFLNQFIFL